MYLSTKRQIRNLLLAVLLLVFITGLVPREVQAVGGECWFGTASCGVTNYGDYGTNDVFTGRTNATQQAIPRSLVGNKEELISFITGRFDATKTRAQSGHNAVGAAFVIDLMTGKSQSWPSRDRELEWARLMRQPSVVFSQETRTVTRSSWYDPGRNNVFFDDRAETTRDTIVIRQHGAIKLVLQRECGNPAGTGTLETDGWRIVPTGSITSITHPAGTPTLPAKTVVRGSRVNLDFAATNYDRNGADNHVAVPGGDWSWAVRQHIVRSGTVVAGSKLQISGNTGTARLDPGERRDVGYVVGSQLVIPSTALIGDRYCRYLRVDPQSSTPGATYRDTSQTELCVVVVQFGGASSGVEPEPQLTSNGTDVVGGELEVGEIVNATARIANNSGSLGIVSNASWRVWFDKAGDQTYDPNPLVDSSPTGWSGSIGSTAVPPGGITIGTRPNISLNSDFAQLCISVTLTPTPPTSVDPATGTRTACVSIVRLPYFEVRNGDVNAAMAFEETGVCTPAAGSTASVRAFNRSLSGSGSNIAAYAAGMIDGFVTKSRAPSGEKFLSFANEGTGNGGSTYGGNGAEAMISKCTDDADFQRAELSPDRASSVAIPEPQGLFVNPILGLKGRRELYVKGDVYITQNIEYADNFALNESPLFKIVATGNIYVGFNVTRLDGIYKSKKSIYTCATPSSFGLYGAGNALSLVARQLGPPSVTDSSVTGMAQACNRALSVSGALVGTDVKLLRTIGTLRNPGAPAEVIMYSPEVWMLGLPGSMYEPVPGAPKLKDTYDAIVNLPPVL